MHIPRILLTASAKGGVGKSTTAAGAAMQYAALGRKVLLVDCDTASRSLELFFDMENAPLFHLGDVILERCLPEAAYFTPVPDKYPTLYFCASPLRRQEEEISEKYGSMAKGILHGCTELAKGFDIVILDTGSGYNIPETLTALADTVLVCTEQSPTSIRAASYTASQLAGMQNVKLTRLVICSFDIRAASKGQRAGMISMIDTSGLKCVGVVPLDKTLLAAQEKGKVPSSRSAAMTAYANIVRRLTGYDVPLFSGMRGMKRSRAL
ncbi:MAG: P-loop NTPase [Clostridia bacterium]|nr:P-loop NTPase [Clostridia bacterium]